MRGRSPGEPMDTFVLVVVVIAGTALVMSIVSRVRGRRAQDDADPTGWGMMSFLPMWMMFGGGGSHGGDGDSSNSGASGRSDDGGWGGGSGGDSGGGFFGGGE